MTENRPEDIKEAVLSRYGRHARQRLEALKQTQQSCCGPAREAVVQESTCSCCSPTPSPADANMTHALYSDDELADLPEDVLSSLGCGNPTAIAELKEGESVLDLGSGGGLDCFLAAQKVGTEGRVMGLDMSADMIQLARRNAIRVGAENVGFRLGEMEEMPFADNSFDVIISNCVINLSPDKDAVLREAYRVLKPGGRLRASDIVWEREPTPEERSDLASWSACVAGALVDSDYAEKLRAAGFVNVRLERKDDRGAEGNLFSAYIGADKAG